MAQIRVTPGALRAGAGRFRDIESQIMTVADSMDSLRRALAGAWYGSGAGAAEGTFAKLVQASRGQAEVAVQLAERLNGVASAFENAGALRAVQIAGADVHVFYSGINAGAVSGAHMSDSVRIEVAEVYHIAHRLANQAEEMEFKSELVSRVVQQLKTDWEGRQCDYFADIAGDYARCLRRLSDDIRDFSQSLRYAAARYEEMDRELASSY